MRFRHPDGSTVHLAYCTNVHPAETLDGVRAQLRDHCEPVRKRLGRDRIGIGLWLARAAAHSLATDRAALRGLRAELDRRGLEVVTLNGFPYEGFGAQEVKYRVYKPDWTDPERLSYTTTLARLLAALLPDDVTEGSISTLPLAWRTPYDQHPSAAATAHAALTTLAERLDALEELTGKSIRIGLEPEPGCTIETTADAIGPLTALANPRIGICVDTCHLATSFEDPATALHDLTTAHINIAKAQLSAALHAEAPHRPEVRAALAPFGEPRFLHQTRTTAPALPGAEPLARPSTLPGATRSADARIGAAGAPPGGDALTAAAAHHGTTTLNEDAAADAVAVADAGTVAGTPADAVAVAPADAGTVAVAAADAGTVAGTPADAVAVAPADAGTVAVAAADAGTVAVAPADAVAVTVAPADAGTVAVAPADAVTGTVAVAPAVTPADAVAVTVAPADAGTVAVAPADAVTGTVAVAPALAPADAVAAADAVTDHDDIGARLRTDGPQSTGHHHGSTALRSTALRSTALRSTALPSTALRSTETPDGAGAPDGASTRLRPPSPSRSTALHGTDDLPEALTTGALPTTAPWRAHFHVPLHTPPAPPLTSTLSVLQDTLTRLVAHPSGHPLTHHLEVETYTWQTLPPELRPRTRAQLADGIAAELALVRDLLTDLGLKELP